MDRSKKIRPETSHRIPALDALRGIAAFMVLLAHCYLIMPAAVVEKIPAFIILSPLQILRNGNLAILLFFILSGYVLSLPYLQNKSPSYFSFLIRRVCRIYIPFAFAIFFTALLYDHEPALMPGEGSPGFRTWWAQGPLSINMILSHLAMTGIYRDMQLNGAMWTLVHEMRISILFPALIILCRDLRRAIIVAALLYIAAFALETLAVYRDIVDPNGFTRTLFITLGYIPVFMFGILLAKHDHAIRGWLSRMKSGKLWLLGAAILLILSLPPDRWDPATGQLDLVYKYAIGILTCVVAGFSLITARHIPAFGRMLMAPPLQWLGKISYSFYLVQMPIMFFVFRLFLGSIPAALILLLDIVAVLITAAIFHALIERPATRLGTYLAKHRYFRLIEKPA